MYNLFRFINEQTQDLQSKVKATLGADVLEHMDSDEVFLRSGALAASMTICQAMWRPLRPEEDRIGLVRKVYSGILKKGGFMRPHKAVAAPALAIAGPMSEWFKSAAPQKRSGGEFVPLEVSVKRATA